MSYQDIVEQAIDKRLNSFYERLESEECDRIDKLIYNTAIGTLEDLKKEIL